MTVRWRSFSLELKNQGTDHYRDEVRQHLAHTLEALEIIEAVRNRVGEEAVGRLYEAYGARIHHDGDRFPAHDEVLREVGLEESWTKAIGDGRWRHEVERSMEEAVDTVGDDIGVPTMVFPSGIGFFGPVISRAPTGDEALQLFDRLVALSETPGFYELKRGRDSRPRFGARP